MIQENFEEGRVTIKNIPTGEQPADIFWRLCCLRYDMTISDSAILTLAAARGAQKYTKGFQVTVLPRLEVYSS